MPVNFLSAAERERFNSFPENLSADDLIAYFTLSPRDHEQIPATTTPANCLGFALQLLLLRFLGFHLPDLQSVPKSVVTFVGAQLGIESTHLENYGERSQTRSDHQRLIEKYLGLRQPTGDDLNLASDWLTTRALEHDRPIVLLQLLAQRLKAEQIVRPGLTILEKMVGTVRERAEQNIYQSVAPLLDEVLTQGLDGLLESASPNRPSQLVRLRESATSNTPKTILTALEKLRTLQRWHVGEWNLSILNPNRRKQLAQIGFRSTTQALQRMSKIRRYPILLALLYQVHEELLDELVELFDLMLYRIDRKTIRKIAELKLERAGMATDKIALLKNLLTILFDEAVPDESIRASIFGRFPKESLQTAFDECRQIGEAVDDGYYEILAQRYSYLRQFIPTFLKALPIDGNAETAGLREAIGILRELDASGKRKIPTAAPVDFISAEWWKQIIDDSNRIRRKFYELCVLFELRKRLRSGDVWVEGSRRYNRIESYLIPVEQWASLARPQVCELLALPEKGSTKLRERQMELEALSEQFDCFFDEGRNIHRFDENGNISDIGNYRAAKKNQNRKNLINSGKDNLLYRPDAVNVRLENGELVVTKLPGEGKSDSAAALEELVSERLPEVELTDILIEVDAWTGFSSRFEHPSGNEPRSSDALSHCYASILAQACNFGLVQMSRMSGFTYRQLAWHTKWYLRKETIEAAFTDLVNFQYHLPLARLWGGGVLSSSDGQRFPVSVKTKNAVALPKYFGYGKGLTYYTWTSDQYSQYGTKVIPTTIRDSTYVLDEILDNETELTILEHTTDTAGYTDLVFGLFDLLGLQFSPRLADLADQTLYRIDKTIEYRNIDSLLTGKINVELILRHWDELLRIAGSLKQGYVTASLLISKLQSYPRQNALTRALQEYGRLSKTIFILKYLQDPEYQKRITRQLNKGEAMHALRIFLFIANERSIRKRNQEEQLNQAACLNLVANAVAVWNTVYIQAALDQLKREGYKFSEDDVRHLSPARSEHINVYGRYYFNIEEGLQRKGLRELRKPDKDRLRFLA